MIKRKQKKKKYENQIYIKPSGENHRIATKDRPVRFLNEFDRKDDDIKKRRKMKRHVYIKMIYTYIKYNLYRTGNI